MSASLPGVTLLIAVLLLVGFDLSWPWWAATVIAYPLHLWLLYEWPIRREANRKKRLGD